MKNKVARVTLVSGTGGPWASITRSKSVRGHMSLSQASVWRLHGRGRGYNQRVRDVQAHPEAYELLCELCHTRHDLDNIPF